MTIAFRNVDGSSADPVDSWPYEALVATLERGGVRDWRPVLVEIRRQPWGPVARSIENYLAFSEDRAIVALFTRAITVARDAAQERERGLVANLVRKHLRASDLSSAEFAERIGTSASRFSTYLSGKVTPSAALMIRMEECAAAVTSSRPRPAALGRT